MTYMVHKIGAVEDARKIKEKKGTVEIKSVIKNLRSGPVRESLD